jgi:hypothetical protein
MINKRKINTVEVLFMETQISAIEKPFSQARQKFDQLCQKLESTAILSMTHSEVESCLQAEGLFLLRQLFQDHLDLRTLREEKAQAAVGQDGIQREPNREQSRQLESVFGTVKVERLGYGKAGNKSIHTLDAELNLPPEKYSHGLQRVLAIEVVRGSYDEALAAVERYTGGNIPKRQAEELMRKAVCDFEAFYAQPVFAQMMSAALLVLSLDAKGIVMRHDDLRQATRQAAAKNQHKLSKRLSKGEKKNRKRMATAATVYSIARHPRTPSQVAKECYPYDEKPAKPKPEGKRVWASVEKEVETIVTEIFEEARQQDPEMKKDWVGLVDGNKTQIRLLEKKAKAEKVKITIIVDLIHVLEYLWKASYAFYASGTQEAQNWVSDKLFRILQGKSSLVAAVMRRQATLSKLTTEKRQSVDDCAQYLLNYKQHLRYNQYLCAGYPIATGVIEGVCRYLIKDRMDRTGARWSLQGAEAILKLRSLVSSGDFEAYWIFHESQEKQRHYSGIRKIFTTTQLSGRKVEIQHDDLQKVA